MINLRKIKKIIPILFLLLGLSLNCYGNMSSSSYRINADVIGVSGNDSTSTNYSLVDTVGEPIIGITSGSTYSASQGFWHMINTSISIQIDSSTVDLGVINPGVPVTGESTITVTTDSWGGYELYANQNHQLTHTDATSVIANYSCSISTPCFWSGTGLGFSVKSGSGVNVKWGDSPNFKYAYFENISTKIHETTSFSSTGDETVIDYKLDTPTTQKSGNYSNTITYLVVSKI